MSPLQITGLAIGAVVLACCGGGAALSAFLPDADKNTSANSTSNAAPDGPTEDAAIAAASLPTPETVVVASPTPPTTKAAPEPSPTKTRPKPPRPSSTTKAPPKPPASKCDPNYSGPCVPIASDVDCAGGSGNGPKYVVGPVYVIGSDIYDLDRDGDGIGCDT